MPEDFIGAAVGGLTQMLGQRTAMAEKRRLREEETLRKMGLWQMEKEAQGIARQEERVWQEGMAIKAQKRRLAETQRQEDIKYQKLGEQEQSTLAGVGLGTALETPMTIGLRREAERLEGEAKEVPWWELEEHQRLTAGVEDARAEIATIHAAREQAAGVPQDIQQDILSGTLKSAAQAKTIMASRKEKAEKQLSRTTHAQVVAKAGAPPWLTQSVKSGETSLLKAMGVLKEVKEGTFGVKKVAKVTAGAQTKAKNALHDAFVRSGLPVTKENFIDFAMQQADIWKAWGVPDEELQDRLIAQLWQSSFAGR